jgi:hypothetical protein
MTELERNLLQLGRELELPESPPLAAAVAAELRAEPTARQRPAAWWRRAAAPRRGPRPARRERVARVLVVATLALLLLAGAAFAFPDARHAVLDFLGLRGETVERSERVPTGPLRPRPVLGREMSLASARAELAFEPLLPKLPGRPPQSYVSRRAEGGALSLAYTPRRGLPAAGTSGVGLLVTEFRGDLDPRFAGKVAGSGTRVERLRVGGERAIWLEGAPHYFFYRGPDGEFEETTLRLAGNVLLLERGRLLVRLEGAMTQERAIAIARSLRAG